MNRFFPNYDNFKITSPYGQRSGGFHYGIDLVAQTGNGGSAVDFITAHSGGTVWSTGYEANGAGNYVYIQVAPNVLMAYFHLKTISVARSQVIAKGQRIGYMGSTGRSTGAHLHWGIKVGNNWIDPTAYLNVDYGEKLVIDGYWGKLTSMALQTVLGVAPDGIFGVLSIKALQKLLSVTVDGIMGKQTITALQHRMGTVEDGIISKPSMCVKAMQIRLNAGTF